MKQFGFALIAFLASLLPVIVHARPIEDDKEELSLKAELAFSQIGENADKNFKFEIVEKTSGKAIFALGRITHLPSGLVCEFDANEELILKSFSVNEAGIITDFSCGIEGYGYSKNLYGYKKMGSIDEQLRTAKIAIEYRFANAIPYEIPMTDFQDTKLKIDNSQSPYILNSKFRAFDIENEGKRLISSVWLYESGDWFYKMRYSTERNRNKKAIADWLNILSLSLDGNGNGE